jgi:hypothetical protein
VTSHQDSAASKEGFEGSGVRPPAIALRKGGGAIRSIGEKFAANPVAGTGSTKPICRRVGLVRGANRQRTAFGDFTSGVGAKLMELAYPTPQPIGNVLNWSTPYTLEKAIHARMDEAAKVAGVSSLGFRVSGFEWGS